MLHVCNGDVVADSLLTAAVPGECTVWADALHEGPVPQGLPPDALREVRVRFLAASGAGTREEVGNLYALWEQGLARASAHEEVVLWYEEDLFDQLLLVQLLERLSGLEGVRLSMVLPPPPPPGRHFTGLGPLPPGALAALLMVRKAVTPAQVDMARRAWAAFRAPTPAMLEALAGAEETEALPFLRAALVRLLEEYPSARSGLGRTAAQVLRLLVQGGPQEARALFRAVQGCEERPFLGDTWFLLGLQRLSAGPHPLLRREGEAWVPTAAGEAVAAGRADAVALNGIDRWLGGVHLTPAHLWRWDEAAGRLR